MNEPSEFVSSGAGFYNEFLFNVTNQFDIEEFKKYTNFVQIMTQVLTPRGLTDQLPKYIKSHFKHSIRDKESWKKGTFRSLKLTRDFYQSDTALRIYGKMYCLKRCSVDLQNLDLTYVPAAKHQNIESQMVPQVGNIETISKRQDVAVDKINLPSNVENSKEKRIRNRTKNPKFFSDFVTLRKKVVYIDDGDENCPTEETTTVHDHPSNANLEESDSVTVTEKLSQPNINRHRSDSQSDVQGNNSPQNVSELRSDLENTTITSGKIQSPANSAQSSRKSMEENEAATTSMEKPIKKRKIGPKSRLQRNVSAQNVLIDNIVDTTTTLDKPLQLASNESSTNTKDQVLINDITNSFNKLISDIKQQFKVYLEQSDPTKLSLSQFWREFLKLQVEPEQLNKSAAEEITIEPITIRQDNAEIIMNTESVAATNAAPATFEEITPMTSVHCFPSPSQTIDQNICSPKENLQDIAIKIEKFSAETNDWNDSVQIIEVPKDSTIVIEDDNTQELINNLEVSRDCNRDNACLVTEIDLLKQPVQCASIIGSTSKGFLTSLRSKNVGNKKRIYNPLDIVVKNISPVELPNYDFSQQPSPPSDNYNIEECTVIESQIQRYELLNKDNTLFLSSQLENHNYNLGHQIDNESQHLSTFNKTPHKRKSTVSDQICKRIRFNENLSKSIDLQKKMPITEFQWRTLDFKKVVFALSSNAFRLECQFRKNFDTFYFNDELSIRRLLNVSEKEWKCITNVLYSLTGYSYNVSSNSLASSDILVRTVECFIKCIPFFAKWHVEFSDFMGNSLLLTEHRTLNDKSGNECVDPYILERMAKLKKELNKIKE